MKVYIVAYENYFLEEWYIKRIFSTRKKAEDYVKGHKPIPREAKLYWEEWEVE
jgi:hypothetical protein